jgi:hypothetical protein
MANKIFKSYKDIDMSTPRGRANFFGALTAFCRKPQEVMDKMLLLDTTQFTSDSGFPTDVRQLIERYHLGLEEIDNGWQAFFDVRDFSGVRTSGFKVRDVQSGLTFTKRPKGGRARIYRVTGTEAYVSFDMYGGGLEFDQAWFDDQEWWLIEDNVAEFRSAWYRDKAAVMYGLIGALDSGYNVAYDTTGSTQLEKDVNTLNTAIAAMITALASAGYAVTANTTVNVLSPIQLKARLNRALNSTYVTIGTAGASLKVEYNVNPIYSTNVIDGGSACTDKWFVGVPGLKNKVGEKMGLTVFTDFNKNSYTQDSVGWGRYGAYLNEAQFRRLATA